MEVLSVFLVREQYSKCLVWVVEQIIQDVENCFILVKLQSRKLSVIDESKGCGQSLGQGCVQIICIDYVNFEIFFFLKVVRIQ